MERYTWEKLGEQEKPSWYLHPLVAKQKRDVHLALIRRWAGDCRPERLLKTDLFEEAFGGDHILGDLFPEARLRCGIDEAFATVRAAAMRQKALAPGFLVTDVRQTALRDGCLDLIISTSTLDHFPDRKNFVQSTREIARLLRPGGRLVLTLDNPWNSLFHPLRWLSQRKGAPFPLGYTPTIATLRRDLSEAGFHVEAEDWLIHNPRGVSTAVFLMLSKLLGRRANPCIATLLAAFALLGQLPTRRFTACFQAITALKRRPPV
ncbi:MAG: class I SAM-dependent methyltransferase [Bryobacteraceae bacterium]